MNIPERIAGLAQWINWRLTNEGRKLPIDALTGRAAKSNDPTTWTDFRTAKATGGLLGFVFAAGGGLVGIDLDGCIVGGEIMPWAIEVLARIPSYAEYSPSGTGIKIWAGGTLPKAFKKELLGAPRGEKQPAIEAYSQGRYFAFTGEHYPDSPAEIVDCQEGIDWLFTKMNPPKAQPPMPCPLPESDHAERIRAYMRSVPPAIEGQGGDAATFAAACKLVLGWGLSPEKAAPYFAEWNSTCEPPWDDRRLFRKLTEADKQPGPRGWLVGDERTETPVDLRCLLGEASSDSPIPADELEPGSPPSIQEEMLRVPGFISDVIDYALEISQYKNIHLAFCGAITLLSTLVARKVQGPTGLLTNILVLGMGNSGIGKQTPREINTEVLAAVGMIDRISGKPASGQGMEDAVYEQPAHLFQIDEFDSTLVAINNPGDAIGSEIAAKIMELHSSAGSSYAMRVKAHRKGEARRVITNPHVSILANCIPQQFFANLTKKLLGNGLVARMLVIKAGPRGRGKMRPKQKIPEKIINVAQWWKDFNPSGGNIGAVTGAQPKEIPYDEDAAEIFENAMAYADDRYEKYQRSGYDAGCSIWARAIEHAHKLALLYACSESHESPLVGRSAAKWATEFASQHAEWLLHEASERSGEETKFEKLASSLMGRVQLKGGRATRSDCLKATKVSAKEFDVVLNTLRERGEVRVSLENGTCWISLQ